MQENHDSVSPENAATEEQLDRALAYLFTTETVEQARLVDAADLNLSEAMIECIGKGVIRLKQLRHDPRAQADLIRAMNPGERLILCMWIMDMGLLDKIQGHLKAGV